MANHRGPLRIAIEDWIDTFDFIPRVQGWFGELFDKPKNFLVSLARPILLDVKDVPGMPKQYQDIITAVTGTEPVTLSVVAVTVVLGVIAGFISGIMQPISRIVSLWIDSGVESARADPSVAFPMMWKSPQYADELITHVKQLGWNETIIDGFEEVLRPRLDLPDLFSLYRRGVLTDAQLQKALNAYGWRDGDIPYLKELQVRIPGPNDLISMAVREAFSPEVVARFGYDEDFPQEFAYWAETQGLTEEWSRRYWTAHWKLPSITAGYEMLHRGIIDKATLSLLLKTADIPAFWREKLMAISYANFTRVDIRRMYEIGVIKSPAEVAQAYMDIGYDEDKALKLTEFTMREYGQETREATKGDILAAYELGRLDTGEALGLLETIDYPVWIAEAYLARVDLKRANKLATELVKSVKTLYIGGRASRTDVVTQLSTIPIPSVEIDRYLEEWDISRKAKISRPSRTDLRRMFLANILDEADYRQELTGHGLTEGYVNWYIEQAKYDLAELARKEVESSMKEAERLLTAAIKTDLDVELSGYSVLIAQANLAIADIKLSMTEGLTVPQIDDAKRVILEFKVMIANYRKSKADLRKAYLIEKQEED